MSEMDGQTIAGAREMIVFSIREQEFCIDVMSIRELRAWTPATPIAHAPSYIFGAINLRGLVLPIIDLAVRLGFPATDPSSRHAVLVVEIGHQAVGLLVEGVSEIMTVRDDQIQPTPDVASQTAKEFLLGLIVLDKRMISLLGLQALVPSYESQYAA